LPARCLAGQAGAATGSGRIQIYKKLSVRYNELLESGTGDMRNLLRFVGAEKTVKVETLRGARTAAPAGGWASDVKLGSIQINKATEILESPHDWPPDIVQNAIEYFAAKMTTVAPISTLAERNRWFQDPV
jgi:hypothetical protein